MDLQALIDSDSRKKKSTDSRLVMNNASRNIIFSWQIEQLKTGNSLNIDEFVGLSRLKQYGVILLVMIVSAIVPALFVFLIFGVVDFGDHENPNYMWNCLWACTFFIVPLQAHSATWVQLTGGSPAYTREWVEWLERNPERPFRSCLTSTTRKIKMTDCLGVRPR